jgi:hypothetical protein
MPTPTHTSHNLRSLGLKTAPPINTTPPPITPLPLDNTANPHTGKSTQASLPLPLKVIHTTTHKTHDIKTIKTPSNNLQHTLTHCIGHHPHNTQHKITGRHSPSNTDIIALNTIHKPDIFFLTETPISKDCDALSGILSDKGYHTHYHPVNTPLPVENKLLEARISASIKSQGEMHASLQQNISMGNSLTPLHVTKTLFQTARM